MVLLHRHHCFLGSSHCPWVWPLIWMADYIQTTLLSDHIVAIWPPLESWFCTRSLQWWQHRWWRRILQRHRTSTPSYCRWRPTRQKLARIDNMTAPCWYLQKVETPVGSGIHLVVAIDGQVAVHAATAWRQRHIPDRFFHTDVGQGNYESAAVFKGQ